MWSDFECQRMSTIILELRVLFAPPTCEDHDIDKPGGHGSESQSTAALVPSGSGSGRDPSQWEIHLNPAPPPHPPAPHLMVNPKLSAAVVPSFGATKQLDLPQLGLRTPGKPRWANT